jgi:cytochrome bd-type quinol oxidase subunit 1
MAKAKSDANALPPAERATWLIATHAERHRTYRMAIIVGGICIGLAVVGWTIVRVADMSWPKVVAIGIATLLPATGILTLRQWILAEFKRYIAKVGDRLASAEARLDPLRSSSGMAKDGSDPREG